MEQLFDFWNQFFDVSDFPARWHCGKWSEFHGWLYIGSNVAIWGAYFTIPFAILYLVIRRSDLPFRRIFILFTLFILFCGATHLMDALIFWFPAYRINAVMLLCTALVSWGTVFKLTQVMPEAMKLKTPEELQKIIVQQTKNLQQANQQLSQKEAQFRMLVQNSPDLVIQYDPQMRILFINDTVEKITGQPPSGFIGKTFHDIRTHTEVSRPYEEEFIAKFERTCEQQQPISFETGTWIEGLSVYYLINIIPLVSASNQTESVMVSIRDITPLRQREEEQKQSAFEQQELSKNLIEKNQRLEQLNYIVSHNLRSPINNIRALTELFTALQTEEEKIEIISKIALSTEKLQATVDNLHQTLIASKTASQALEEEDITLQNLMENVMVNVSEKIQQLGAQVRYDFSAAPLVRYPKVYLESIFLNLLSNALKYHSPERTPEIFFKSFYLDGKLALSCQDNGLGIDLQKHASRIFGFQQTFHPKKDSRGVGLFITKKQVESLGGKISVESQMGFGTTFTIIFRR